jgi:hypothetical protein
VGSAVKPSRVAASVIQTDEPLTTGRVLRPDKRCRKLKGIAGAEGMAVQKPPRAFAQCQRRRHHISILDQRAQSPPRAFDGIGP